KVEPLNCILRDPCQKHEQPASNVIVHKRRIHFGGKSYYTYQMSSKPITKGSKVFVLCNTRYTYN
ncbi:hypothetical protein C7212DRAFT_154861, partial [Tuber magnatum]